MHFSERSTSAWKTGLAPLITSPLQEDIEVVVWFVAAGFAGVSFAYELGRAGREVVGLDVNALGGGETAQTTAHHASALDDHYFTLEQLHGQQGARRAYESHDAAIGRIEEIV